MQKLLDVAALICTDFYNGDVFFLPIIRKTLIHDAIFNGLIESGMGDLLCFQGGTALRRCYALPRLSEDLDFVSGKKLPGKEFDHLTKSFEDVIRRELRDTFDIREDVVQVKNPVLKEMQYGSIGVERWSVQLVMDERGRKDRIHIEIVNVPSHKNHQVRLLPAFEGSAAPNFRLKVETLDEILADKVMAAASRPYRKYRDYFDLGWLWAKSMAHGSPVVDTSLILKKASDYKERIEPFLEKLSAACEIRNEDKEGFHSELSRFMSIKKKELDSVYEAYFLRGIEFLTQIHTKTTSMYQEVKQRRNEYMESAEGQMKLAEVKFDASRDVPIANDNRPICAKAVDALRPKDRGPALP